MYKIIYKSDDFGRKGESATIVDYDEVRLYTIVFDNDELKEEYTCTEKDFTRIPYKVRGFEVCTGYEDVAKLPTRGSVGSAGYDFYSPVEFSIKPKDMIMIHTGIKAYMLSDETLQVYIRSSVGIGKETINANCVCIIDSDYYNNPKNEGNIILALYNRGTDEQHFNKGDKLVQGIFTKYLLADNDNATGERTGGIGSTGK